MARLLACSISRIESGSEGAASAEAGCCAERVAEPTILLRLNRSKLRRTLYRYKCGP